jgi:hypothetical protein
LTTSRNSLSSDLFSSKKRETTFAPFIFSTKKNPFVHLALDSFFSFFVWVAYRPKIHPKKVTLSENYKSTKFVTRCVCDPNSLMKICCKFI